MLKFISDFNLAFKLCEIPMVNTVRKKEHSKIGRCRLHSQIELRAHARTHSDTHTHTHTTHNVWPPFELLSFNAYSTLHCYARISFILLSKDISLLIIIIICRIHKSMCASVVWKKGHTTKINSLCLSVYLSKNIFTTCKSCSGTSTYTNDRHPFAVWCVAGWVDNFNIKWKYEKTNTT